MKISVVAMETEIALLKIQKVRRKLKISKESKSSDDEINNTQSTKCVYETQMPPCNAISKGGHHLRTARSRSRGKK